MLYIFLMSWVKMCVLCICISRLSLQYFSIILRSCAMLFPPYATSHLSLNRGNILHFTPLHFLMAKLLCTCRFDSQNIRRFDVQISANHWYVRRICRSTYHNDISTMSHRWIFEVVFVVTNTGILAQNMMLTQPNQVVCLSQIRQIAQCCKKKVTDWEKCKDST